MLNKVEAQKILEVMDDPVKWAQIFITTYDKVLKKDVAWTPRWYQVGMLRDKALKIAARCGRRTGKLFA